MDPFTTSLAPTESDRIAWASARIRNYCGWHIAPSVSETSTLDADGGHLLLLRTLHLTAVSSVTVDDTALGADDYRWSEIGTLRRISSPWPCTERSVVVAYTHGYAEIPDEIVEVCVAVASRMPAQIASISQEAAGGVSRSFGGLLSGQASLSAGWTMAEQLVLDRYRIGRQP